MLCRWRKQWAVNGVCPVWPWPNRAAIWGHCLVGRQRVCCYFGCRVDVPESRGFHSERHRKWWPSAKPKQNTAPPSAALQNNGCSGRSNCRDLGSGTILFRWAWSVLFSSVAVLAEIPLRSPQKIFIFIIKKYMCWLKVSKNKVIYILKKTSLLFRHPENTQGCRHRHSIARKSKFSMP